MRRNQRGFSLIELMISVAIVGLIVLGLVNIFGGGLKIFFFEKDMINIQQNARGSMNLMVREFREIGDGVGENYGDKIAYATADLIRFLIDTDEDGQPEIITYYLGTNTITGNLQLMRAIDDTSTMKIVALTRSDVRVNPKPGTNSTLFQYTLASGTKTANPTAEQLYQIRLITITLQVEIGSGTTTEVTLVSQVKLRNL